MPNIGLILDLGLILETPSTADPLLLGRLQSRQAMDYIQDSILHGIIEMYGLEMDFFGQ